MPDVAPTHVADPAGTLCPECLTPLLVDDDPPGGPRACPQGDYAEESDSRAPLPSYAEQEATVAEDERLREARAGAGDLRAGSETPAQCRSRMEAWHPEWYQAWQQTDRETLPEGAARRAHPRREVQEQQRRQAELARGRAAPPHWRSSEAPETTQAREAQARAEREREAARAKAPEGPKPKDKD